MKLKMGYRIEECDLIGDRWILYYFYGDYSGDRYRITSYCSLKDAEAGMKNKIKDDAERKKKRREARSYTYDENGDRIDG